MSPMIAFPLFLLVATSCASAMCIPKPLQERPPTIHFGHADGKPMLLYNSGTVGSRSGRKHEVRLKLQHKELDVESMDPWGLERTRESMDLPSWACDDPDEQRQLAAMKLVLQRVFQRLDTQTVLGPEGEKTPVTKAFPDVYGDLRLLRFLRKDEANDPVSAAVLFREFIEWRQANQVDDIRLQIEKVRPLHPPSEHVMLSRLMPCELRVYQAGKGTVPVRVNVGEWKMNKISKLVKAGELPQSSLLQHCAFMLESLYYHLHKKSLRVEKLVCVDAVCDFSTVTFSRFSFSFVWNVIQPWMHMINTFYPTSMNQIVLQEPPMWLAASWEIAAPMLGNETVSKVSLNYSH